MCTHAFLMASNCEHTLPTRQRPESRRVLGQTHRKRQPQKHFMQPQGSLSSPMPMDESTTNRGTSAAVEPHPSTFFVSSPGANTGHVFQRRSRYACCLHSFHYLLRTDSARLCDATLPATRAGHDRIAALEGRDETLTAAAVPDVQLKDVDTFHDLLQGLTSRDRHHLCSLDSGVFAILERQSSNHSSWR